MAKNQKKKPTDNIHYIIQTMNLFTTNTCNFACSHCKRGDLDGNHLDDRTIASIFKNVYQIDTLNLNGGEVFSNPEILRKVLNRIKEKNIVVFQLSIITNGTLFTPEIEAILDDFSIYLAEHGGRSIQIPLSQDRFHSAQLEKIKRENPSLYEYYQENINRLQNSSYYGGINELGYIINEGRAKNLDIAGKIETRAYPHICYLDRKTLKELDQQILFLGGITGIDVNGIFCDTAGVMPPTPERRYGNLKTHSYYEIAKRAAFPFEKTFDDYSERCASELKKTNQYFNPPGTTFENQGAYTKHNHTSQFYV